MSNKIYVGNLSFKIDDAELKNIFSEFGEIIEAKVIRDKYNKNRSKGFGFVTFSKEEDAQKAIQEMNGKEIEGRKIKVNEARPIEAR